MSTVLEPVYKWKTLPWKDIERKVFKLQKRIYQAAKCKEKRETLHKLQRLLIGSWHARCLAVRRVSQDNRGKKTAGIDGVKHMSPAARLRLVNEIRRPRRAQPVRRVWIPKPGKDEKRPLGIPTMHDRAHQALVKLALEPEWEAKFELHSYGFRPGRSCHDAIEAIFIKIKAAARYVLDADIRGCFDNIDQEALLRKLETFPTLRRVIHQWLKAGVMEGLELHRTEHGTPQGGVISPLLANIALHGLEDAICTAFPKRRRTAEGLIDRGCRPHVVRYADDFVVLHRELDVVIRCKEIVSNWLAGIGLELKDSKTRITHTLDAYEGKPGFDFLGFTVRQFRVGKRQQRNCGRNARRGTNPKVPFKTIISPSKDGVKRHYRTIATMIGQCNSSPQRVLIEKLNPRIRGWCNYYSTVVSKKTFSKLDHLVCQRLLRWGRRRHPNSSRRRMVAKYFNTRRDKGSYRPWDFMTKDGARLFRYADTRIIRHGMVKTDRSPFDGDFVYWSMRMGRHPMLPPSIAKALRQQNGKCRACGLCLGMADNIRFIGGLVTHAHCPLADDPASDRSTADKGRTDEEPYELETLTYGSEDEPRRRRRGSV